MSRLPLELCILIIDAVGSNRRAGHWDDGYTGGGISTLKSCSLVCKAWYHHTTPYLWSSLVIDIQRPEEKSKDSRLTVSRNTREPPTMLAEVLNIFQSNPKLMASVRHLLLIFPWNVEKHELMAIPELVAFCKALAPLPRFSWEAEDFDDDTIFTSSGEVADDDDHPLGQIVSSFCQSSTLTTFTFSGAMFPLDVLKATPNLKDISFENIAECPVPWSPDGSSSLQLLPFRLRRARFSGAECVYEMMIEFEEIFSQLEELVVISLHGENMRDADLATLVCLPQGTLKVLNIEIDDCRAFARGLLEQELPLKSLRTVESCSIRILGLHKMVTSRRRARLLGILEAAPEGLLDKLESLNLKLQIIAVPLFDTIFDPEHRAWRIAKDLLGPNGAPALKSLSITPAWSKTDAHFASYNDIAVNQSITSQCLEMLESCAPRWEDDARNVEIILKINEPSYRSEFRTPFYIPPSPYLRQ